MTTNAVAKKIITFSLIAFLLTSCTNFLNGNIGAMELKVSADFFKLSWNHAGKSNSFYSDNTSLFRVYYRPHGTLEWKLYSEQPYSQNPEVVISSYYLDYGIYDFAVSYINSYGEESPIHSSLDSAAHPVVGWYVNWSSYN